MPEAPPPGRIAPRRSLRADNPDAMDTVGGDCVAGAGLCNLPLALQKQHPHRGSIERAHAS